MATDESQFEESLRGWMRSSFGIEVRGVTRDVLFDETRIDLYRSARPAQRTRVVVSDSWRHDSYAHVELLSRELERGARTLYEQEFVYFLLEDRSLAALAREVPRHAEKKPEDRLAMATNLAKILLDLCGDDEQLAEHTALALMKRVPSLKK